MQSNSRYVVYICLGFRRPEYWERGGNTLGIAGQHAPETHSYRGRKKSSSVPLNVLMELGPELGEVLGLYTQAVVSGETQRDVNARVGKRLLRFSGAQQVPIQPEQEIFMIRTCRERVEKKGTIKKTYE